jgi:hypothetical protein
MDKLDSDERDRKFPETEALRLRLQANEISGVSFIALGFLGKVTVSSETLRSLMEDNLHHDDVENIEGAAREASSIVFREK